MKKAIITAAVIFTAAFTAVSSYASFPERIRAAENEAGLSHNEEADIRERISILEEYVGIPTDELLTSYERLEALEEELGIEHPDGGDPDGGSVPETPDADPEDTGLLDTLTVGEGTFNVFRESVPEIVTGEESGEEDLIARVKTEAPGLAVYEEVRSGSSIGIRSILTERFLDDISSDQEQEPRRSDIRSTASASWVSVTSSYEYSGVEIDAVLTFAVLTERETYTVVRIYTMSDAPEDLKQAVFDAYGISEETPVYRMESKDSPDAGETPFWMNKDEENT